LLPAGDESCLRAAVNNGADAVYLGLNRFNARMSAGNFNEKNIFGAIDYCHKRNVRVYVALNTLIKNDELAEYFRLINMVYAAGADAILIQDPCFIPLRGVQNSFALPLIVPCGESSRIGETGSQ
jgi:putative protease